MAQQDQEPMIRLAQVKSEPVDQASPPPLPPVPRTDFFRGIAFSRSRLRYRYNRMEMTNTNAEGLSRQPQDKPPEASSNQHGFTLSNFQQADGGMRGTGGTFGNAENCRNSNEPGPEKSPEMNDVNVNQNPLIFYKKNNPASATTDEVNPTTFPAPTEPLPESYGVSSNEYRLRCAAFEKFRQNLDFIGKCEIVDEPAMSSLHSFFQLQSSEMRVKMQENATSDHHQK